ncbi:MAG: hypothetical protein M1833_004316 [Piccolia ochrophora]|nr:MAG: hypothetical protein M1833_004316 [Piccolia ochrophora]
MNQELHSLDRYLGLEDHEHEILKRNESRGRDLGHLIEITSRSRIEANELVENKNVRKAIRGVPASRRFGPILVMAKTVHHFYKDITMADFRDVVDHFLSDARDPVELSGNGKAIKSLEKVKGVQISCESDQHVFGISKYVSVDIPEVHPVLQGPVSPISKEIGVPLRAWKRRGNTDYNEAAMSLFTNIKPNNYMWRSAPATWKVKMGSVLVVRSDGKDISPFQVEVICHFCQFMLQPLFQDSLGLGECQRTRADVLASITETTFEGFFYAFRQQQLAQTPGVAAEESPVLQ